MNDRESVGGAVGDSTWIAGRVDFQRWSVDGLETGSRAFPEEMPIAFLVNGIEYAVMLASPADVTDFAYGFLLGEGLIRDGAVVESVEVTTRPEGMIARVRLYGDLSAPPGRARRLAGVSSCGLCGVQSLRDAIKPMARVSDGPMFSGAAIRRAMAGLRDLQPYNAVAGAMHAAAFARPDGSLVCAREDVGRHNALDKLIGALLRQRLLAVEGFIVMSSRCSYELVQKASAAGVRLLCTVSAPTALAVRLSIEANISLVSLVRGESFLVVAGGERIRAESNTVMTETCRDE